MVSGMIHAYHITIATRERHEKSGQKGQAKFLVLVPPREGRIILLKRRTKFVENNRSFRDFLRTFL